MPLRSFPFLTRDDVVDHATGLYGAGPLRNHRHAEAAFEGRALFAPERRVATVRPAEDFRAVVAGKDDDGVVGDAKIIHFLEDAADFRVQFHHGVGIETEAALVLPFRRKMRPDMGARGIVPKEERLVGLDGTIHEVDGPAN